MIETCDENWDNVFSRGFCFYFVSSILRTDVKKISFVIKKIPFITIYDYS